MRPLQLISILSFIFLLLSKVFSTAPNAKLGCPDSCGGIPIPYPFGVGPSCYLKPSFNINCNTSTYPPKPYLSIFNGEVVEINRTYIRVKYPNLISACYDYRGTGINVKQSNMTVDLSGTPYTLSDFNRVTAIGCDDMVLPSNGSFADGGCSAFCADTKDVGSGDVGYCPFNATSFGNGCCEARITRDTTLLGAQLIDLSGNLQRKKLFPCSYAFIQERMDTNESVFSYPLYYLHNSTALLNDNWASTTRPPVVRLDWNIEAQNCTEVERNSSTYACQDDKSVCVDIDSGKGYTCGCVQGYEGNPYVLGGCQAISVSSSIAKFGCEDQCGRFSIPFPFGMGRKYCYLEPSFEVICIASTNPPTPYLRILDKEIIELNATRVRVKYPNLGTSCNNSKSGIAMIEKQSLIIDLSSTQYTMSEENWITAIGCNDMVVVKARRANRSFIGSSCAAVCSDIYSHYHGDCPFGDTTYDPGDGCCRAPIRKGTSYLEANLTDLSGRWTRTNITCSYTFVDHKSQYPSFYRSMDNSTVNPLDGTIYYRPPILALEWRIGTLNCKEARRDQTTFVCQSNSNCVDFDATIHGYLCNCSEGYKGNPYLSPGCQDIDECIENTNFPCDSNSNCINTPGSFNCLCPQGYVGDGRKDGKGCIKLPPSKSKMIILIGMGSGLGFLLLLLMCFWLYKMLKKRKEKILKDKFFKRNGGLLLRQQTNEGTIGKTKVFRSVELEVATDHFNASRILGQGAQGTVYKGMLTDGKIVAVKKSKLVEENQLEQFINEVVILSQINHRNVVKLLGCCLETEVPLLVYEFMPNGTLYDLIHDPNIEFPFPWNMRLKIAADIAGALSYLHSASTMPIYHRDIKSSNILLDEKYVVKVSDFGTSRSIAIDQTHLTTLVKGTFGYLDPEYFQSSQFTEKSDVYSFGVVLIELLTGQRPISFDKTEEERGLATRFLRCMEEECLETILDPLVLEESKREEVILVARLAQRCLNLKGRMRPTMKEVANELESYRMSQISIGVEEAMRGFEEIVTTISDSEYTWTGNSKSAAASSSDSYPLMSATD